MAKWQEAHDLELPRSPGVYAIYFGEEVVYVGSSFDVRKRLFKHKINYSRYSNWIENPWSEARRDVRVKYRVSDVYGDWAMHELRLIRRLKPRFNKRDNPAASCAGNSDAA